MCMESAKKFLSTSPEIDLNKVIQTRQSSSGSELTPLMLACKLGHLKMMELLIEKGADVNFSRVCLEVSCGRLKAGCCQVASTSWCSSFRHTWQY